MKNIVSVFAGRRPTLEILLSYLRKAIEQKIIDEVHLWNYTKNNDDALFLRTISNIKRTSSQSNDYTQASINVIKNSITFRVRASNDIHILLSDKYEIVLGGWGNTRSCVRIWGENREIYAIDQSGIAENDCFIEFRIAIYNRFLFVYKNEVLLMIKELPEHLDIHKVSFKTGFGSVGMFEYETTDNNGFFLMNPCETGYKDYYHHYTSKEYENDIIMKCDDDIVFIDLRKLPKFIEYVKNTEYDLVFANNGVSAYFQQNRDGLFPKEQFDELCGKKTTHLHEYFIEHFLEYDYGNEVIPITNRYSVNFFGYRGKDCHKINGDGDDVYDLTLGNTQHGRNVVFPDFYVSHLSFYDENHTGIDLDSLIEKYNQLFIRHFQ
jgi:hypothetical protein